jgi:hypothetical protein
VSTDEMETLENLKVPSIEEQVTEHEETTII